MRDEKRKYFEWREGWIGYEHYDSYLDEDAARRLELSVTAEDKLEWREIRRYRICSGILRRTGR